jgi:hypothetical protein
LATFVLVLVMMRILLGLGRFWWRRLRGSKGKE